MLFLFRRGQSTKFRLDKTPRNHCKTPVCELLVACEAEAVADIRPCSLPASSASLAYTLSFSTLHPECSYPTPRLKEAAFLSKEAAILLILAAKLGIMPPIFIKV